LDDYQARRYETALQWLSLYLSLYPADNNVPLAMFAVAGIQLAMKRPLSAFRIFSHILERHAETPEAIESMMALADMSLLYPGLKPSIALSGAQWYLDPVMAYDQVLSKNPSEEMTERVLLQRISALRLKGRYREAYDAGHRFLERYPRTNHQYVLVTALRSDVENVIEERIAAGDDLAVISIVSHASRKNVIKMNDTDILIKAAGSYGRLGMTDESRRLLSATRPFAMGHVSRIDAALEALSKTAAPPAASSPEMERWRLYEAGRLQIHTSTRSEAEKTLAQMKGTPQDAFWSKLAEFALNDGPWSIKYKDYLK
jgi:tetratricopeptide (TPR) repeat protein